MVLWASLVLDWSFQDKIVDNFLVLTDFSVRWTNNSLRARGTQSSHSRSGLASAFRLGYLHCSAQWDTVFDEGYLTAVKILKIHQQTNKPTNQQTNKQTNHQTNKPIKAWPFFISNTINLCEAYLQHPSITPHPTDWETDRQAGRQTCGYQWDRKTRRQIDIKLAERDR